MWDIESISYETPLTSHVLTITEETITDSLDGD